MRIHFTFVAGLLAAFTGCAGLGGSASAQPQLPRVAFGVDPNAPVQPPAPITQIPTGETRPDPPTGWERYAPSNLSGTIEEAWGQGLNEPLARQQYAEGDALYCQRKFAEAAAKYKVAARRWPDTVLEEDALLMEGESYFFADRYSKADDVFGQLIKKFPNTRHISRIVAREFAIAVYWQQYDAAHPHWAVTPNFNDNTRPIFDTWGNGMKAYDLARIYDPRGPLADEALMAVANAHFVKGHYDDADYYYKLICTDYPKSKYQLQAHLLDLQAKLHRYQGPGYDAKPLKEAEELIDQTIVQFGPQLGGEKDRLLTAKAEIHAQQALRSYVVAQFYDKGQYYAAAKVYYNDIVKQYPQTQLAQVARGRLDTIKMLPDNPPDRYVLLAVMFDGERLEKEKEREIIDRPAAAGTVEVAAPLSNGDTVQK